MTAAAANRNTAVAPSSPPHIYQLFRNISPPSSSSSSICAGENAPSTVECARDETASSPPPALADNIENSGNIPSPPLQSAGLFCGLPPTHALRCQPSGADGYAGNSSSALMPLGKMSPPTLGEARSSSDIDSDD